MIPIKPGETVIQRFGHRGAEVPIVYAMEADHSLLPLLDQNWSVLWKITDDHQVVDGQHRCRVIVR